MDTKELLKKGFSGAVSQYMATIVNAIFGFFISISIIRNLTVEEFGVYNFIFSVIILAQIITSFGLPQVIQRYLPEYRQKNNNQFQKQLVGKAMLIRFVAGFAFIIILLSIGSRIGSLFNLPTYAIDLFPVLALIILLVLESQILGDAALLALLETEYWNLCKVIYTILKLVLFIGAILLGYGLKGIMFAWIIIEVLLFILFLIKANSIIFSLPKGKEDAAIESKTRIINFGKYNYLNNLMYFFRDKASDVFILSYFIGAKAVGLYSFAFGIPYALMQFSPGAQLKTLLSQLLIRRFSMTNKKEELLYYFKFVNRFIFFIMAPVFAISIILSDKIILYMFNPEYIKVKNLFILSLSFMAIQQFAVPYYAILNALEKGRIIFISSLAGLYNLTLAFILIPLLGVLGAIIATGSAGILLILYYYFALKKSIKLIYPWRSFARCSLNIIFMALIVFFMKRFIFDIFFLFFVVSVGVSAYFIISYINKSFEARDRELINSAIGRRMWVF